MQKLRFMSIVSRLLW